MKSLICFLLTAAFSTSNLNSQNSFPSKNWETSTPLSQQLNNLVFEDFSTEISTGKFGYVDDIFITRNGKLVYQKKFQHDYAQIYGEKVKIKSGLNGTDPAGPYNYFNSQWHPYYKNTDLHTLQSVTKSVVSVIIGIAITRNEFPDINTPVLFFFDTSKVKNIDDRKRRMTIRHLLTMTGGFEWEEWNSFDDPTNDCAGMEASHDWVEYTINKPMVTEPGQRFKYSSGGSQLLAHIFKKATGKDIEKYASDYLFKPLQIENHYWKRTPTDLPDTEGGLYLRPADLAKIAYLFLQKGSWEGKQLFTAAWADASITPASSVTQSVKYGYKWWLMPYSNNPGQFAWACRGFGDQAAIIIPEYNIVAVFTGWNIAGGASLSTNEMIKRLVNAVIKEE